MGHWRNTYKFPRFWILDARVAIFFLLFLLHIRMWSFICMIIIFGIFYIMERYGLDFASAFRAVRSYMAGPIRDPISKERMRHPIDYDRRPLF